jgi:hypothetical protein
LQVCARPERFPANVRHTVGNVDILQVLTLIKCAVADARYAIGDVDTLQVLTLIERVVADTYQIFGHYNTLQVCARTERFPTDSPHTIGDNDVAARTDIFYQNSVFNSEVSHFSS